jgi:hypothetical protein
MQSRPALPPNRLAWIYLLAMLVQEREVLDREDVERHRRLGAGLEFHRPAAVVFAP